MSNMCIIQVYMYACVYMYMYMHMNVQCRIGIYMYMYMYIPSGYPCLQFVSILNYHQLLVLTTSC